MAGPSRPAYIPAMKNFRTGVHASDQIITSIQTDTYFGRLFFFYHFTSFRELHTRIVSRVDCLTTVEQTKTSQLVHHHEQDAVLPLSVCRCGFQEPDVLHPRCRPRQRWQSDLERLQPPSTALRRRGSAYARTSQARIDARGDARDFQSDRYVALVPQATTGCAGRRCPAVANTVLWTSATTTPTTTVIII